VVLGHLFNEHVAGLSQIYHGQGIFFLNEVVIFKLLRPDQRAEDFVEVTDLSRGALLRLQVSLHSISDNIPHLHVQPSQRSEDVVAQLNADKSCQA